MTRLAALLLFLLAGCSVIMAADSPPTAWSPDGSNIVVAAKLADGYGIYILDSEGRKHDFVPFAHQVLTAKWRDSESAMCLLARQTDGRSYLWLANSTGIIERLSSRPVFVGDSPSANHFDCSPDGQYVVFPSGSGKDVDLWRVNTETGAEKRLTTSGGRDFSPAWSPNGRWIAFSSERGGTAGIWIMSADGGAVRRVADGPGSEMHPTWAPESDRLAYLVKGKGEGIYVCSISGGKSKPVAIGGQGYAAPTWSSTGKWIAFIYGKNPANIFCTPLDKAKGWGPYFQATFDRSKDTHTDLRTPVWSPTCDQLVFTTFEEGRMSVRLTNISPSYGAMRSSDVFVAPGTASSVKSKPTGDR